MYQTLSNDKSTSFIMVEWYYIVFRCHITLKIYQLIDIEIFPLLIVISFTKNIRTQVTIQFPDPVPLEMYCSRFLEPVAIAFIICSNFILFLPITVLI